MLVLVRLKSVPQGALGQYVVGNLVSNDPKAYELDSSVRVLETVGPKGEIIHNWISDKFFTQGKATWFTDDFQFVRHLDDGDVSIAQQYEKSLAASRAEKAGIHLTPNA